MTFGLLRVKNESRWIARAIGSIKPLCDEILVYDDGSDDGTPRLCDELGCSVIRAKSGYRNEPEAKDALLEYMWNGRASIGDYVIWIDGDEALVPEDIPNLEAAIDYGVDAAAFRIVYLWNDKQTVRVDGIYSTFSRPSMFRLVSRNLSFLRTTHGGGFHCSNVPQQLINKAAPIPVRLLHYGYMEREERIRKYCWYNAKEWGPGVSGRVNVGANVPEYWVTKYQSRDRIPPGLRLEDGYRHMVIGDVFPADSRFSHGGPLKLIPLDEVRNEGRWSPRVHGHYDARTSTFEPPEMAGVLEHHKVLLNGREVRWVWYFDTKEGVVKTYDPQPDYVCRECGGEVHPCQQDGEMRHGSPSVHGKEPCPGSMVDVSQFEELDGPLIVSGESWTLRGKVEVVRK